MTNLRYNNSELSEGLDVIQYIWPSFERNRLTYTRLAGLWTFFCYHKDLIDNDSSESEADYKTHSYAALI